MATSINFPTSPSINDTYTYGNTTYIWDGIKWSIKPSDNTLSALTDTELSATTDGDILTYDSATSKWEAASGATSAVTLSALTDTELSATTDGYVLTYDSSTSKWISSAPALLPNSVGLIELESGFTETNGNITIGSSNFGEQIYTTPGSYLFTATTTSVSVLCIGGGGGGHQYSSYSHGGGGGGLGWRNNIPVISGNTYVVNVGVGGTKSTYGIGSTATAGGDSNFTAGSVLVQGSGGEAGSYNSNSAYRALGGTYSGTSGGNGGDSGGNAGTYASGGGGAGGYSGNGGAGGVGTYASGSAGAGGGAGGGGNAGTSDTASGGGGTGLFGEGASGGGGTGSSGDAISGGGGGSGGTNGGIWNGPANGGLYGGGGGGSDTSLNENGNGGNGAVRIIWGIGAEFPSSGTTSGTTSEVININWTEGIQFTYTLTGNTYINFLELVEGKTITLVIDGNYTLAFPSGINVADIQNFDGTLVNYIQIYCVDTINNIFIASLKNYP